MRRGNRHPYPLLGVLLLGLSSILESRCGRAAVEPLRDHWKLQSSCVAKASGKEISSLAYRPEGWIPALVPGTVLASQVASGIFPDPFFGMNLRKIPGTDYPTGKIFGYLPMSDSSPYRCSWWYRTEFETRGRAEKKTWLHLNGINYRANLWVDGKRVAGSDTLAGAFRSYDLDISAFVRAEGRNALAVEVFAPTEKDLAIDFLDWNPAPADKSMGLWRDVSIATTGPVRVASPAVSTHLTKDDLSEAELTVVADLRNGADHAVTASVVAQVGAVTVRQQVQLAARETRAVLFHAGDYPQLRRRHPRLWWPYQYGEPHLETLRVTASVDGEESDSQSVKFGVREVESYLNSGGALQFRINGRDILVRGGGWAPDLFYREPAERLRRELTYVKHMHLNAIRLEGKLGDDAMFDLADEMGIFILAGWQCCDAWQQWDKWTPADHAIAAASTYSQISRLRAHPSLLAWLNGSDEAPSQLAEREALEVLRERHWPNPVLSAASDRNSVLTGKTGVKMTGPYDYVPPEYWYLDRDRFGGAFGFNTETGPGAAIPPAPSIRRTLPAASWWRTGSGQDKMKDSQDENWKFHAALGKFAQYKNFNAAMSATYGEADSLEDYSLKAQLMAYDGERAMFEAYGAHKYRSTGVIQWMLNDAWPSFFWHLYDYYLVPGGGYFGTRKANEPLHIQYGYDDRKAVVVNSTLKSFAGLTAEARVYDLKGAQLFAGRAEVTSPADGVTPAVSIPVQDRTVFLKLELRDAEGRIASENLYWIPARLASLDWDKTTYVNTPAIAYADMRDLSTLPPARVTVEAAEAAQPGTVTVRIVNRGTTVAFFLFLRAVKRGTGEDIAPILWDDNCITLLPNESRILSASGLPENDARPEIELTGWNVKARTIPVESK